MYGKPLRHIRELDLCIEILGCRMTVGLISPLLTIVPREAPAAMRGLFSL